MSNTPPPPSHSSLATLPVFVKLRYWPALWRMYAARDEETPLMPELGRRYLTPDLRRELASYTEEELFSNKVRFVLRGLR